MKTLKRIFGVIGKLHLGLYLLFSLTVAFGGTTAFFFEKYSIMDAGGVRTPFQEAMKASAEGREYKTRPEVSEKLFKSLNFQKKETKDGRMTFEAKSANLDYTFLFLLIWLLPLYRHYFSGKPQDPARIERRIINLPLVLFALGWVVALQRYFGNMSTYSEYHGAVPPKIQLVFAVSALLLGAFVSYLNLEVTGLYIRRYIARPFFAETNPHGLKRGFAISLALRYALMVFSLAMVPLLLSFYVSLLGNLELFARFGHTKAEAMAWLGTPGNIQAAVPVIIIGVLAGLMLVFQAVSIFLYRYNVQVPVSALVRRMKAVAAGDFDCKTSVLYADELGQLKGHFNLMLDGLVERDHIKDTFGRYVSLEIAEKIMKSGKVNLAGEEIQATVLFSDIKDFTPLSENMPPAELIRFLNEYFTCVTRPIADNKGVINKFIGDAVMAIFSPVFGVEDHRAAAVRAALGMREALKDFNARGGRAPVHFGVGVHSGPLVAGNVGTETRVEYTVLGDTVNVASRVESQTRHAGTELLLSEAVMENLDRAAFPGVVFTPGPPVLMKGKSKPMVLYRAEAA